MTRKEFQAQLAERIGLFHLNYTAYLDADLVTLRYDMEDPNPVSPTVPVAEVDQVLDWAEAHARATYRAQVAARPQIKIDGYVGPDPKREVPIGYRVFSTGGPFLVRYPDDSLGPKAYIDIGEAIFDAQFHAMAWPTLQPNPEDTAMTPTQLRQQLPTGYTATFSDGYAIITTPNGYRSQPFNPWSGALAWAQQHDKEAYADAVARLPAGFGVSSYDLELSGYRLLHPKAILPEPFMTRGIAADHAVKLAPTLDQIPEGYRVVGKITGSLTTWTVVGPNKQDITTSYSLEGAMFAARGHEQRGELAPGYKTQQLAPGRHQLVLPGGEVISGFPNAEAAMLASWDHLAEVSKHVREALDEGRLSKLSIPEWAAQGNLLEKCQADAPFGFTLERQGDFHFRVLGPDGVHVSHNLKNPEEALAQTKRMDARRVEHAIYCPAGYMVRNLSEDPGDVDQWSAFREGSPAPLDKVIYDRRDWAVGAARDHALQQEKGRHYIDTSHYEQTGTFTVHARRTLDDGRTIPEGWGMLQSARAWRAGTQDGWNVTQPNGTTPINLLGRDEPIEWPTPEAALDFIEAFLAAALKGHSDEFLLQHLAVMAEATPPTSEDTAMSESKPSNTPLSLQAEKDKLEACTVAEINKMVSLLEHGEWADTFPASSLALRLQDQINNMIGLQRKSDEAGHLMAEQLEKERSRQETNPGYIKQMTDLTMLLEARDFDAVAALETTFSGSQALQAAVLAVLQERDDANETLTRMTVEEPHNWAKATYELDALLASARQGEAEVKDCDATTPVSKPWKDLLIELMHAAQTSTAARDFSQAAFDELMDLRDLFAKSDLAGLETYDTRFAAGAAWQDTCVHALRTLQMPNPELPPAFKSAAVELALAVLDSTVNRVPYAYRLIRLAAGVPALEHKV